MNGTYSIYKVLRSIFVIVLATVSSVYVLLYILLSVHTVQDKIRDIGESELSKLLKTNVTIGELQISPFNQVVLYDVCIPDQKNDTLLKVDKLGAGISIYNLIAKRRVVFTYAEIIGLDGRINKPDKQSATNLQFIIDALSPKDKNKPATKFDLRIHNIVIRKGHICYDVLNETHKQNAFDPNHVEINDLRADIAIPKLSNEELSIAIKRLSLAEKSGLKLENLTSIAKINGKRIELSNLRIELPKSVIAPDDITLQYKDLKDLKSNLSGLNTELRIANSYVTPADFSAFNEVLKSLDDPVYITAVLKLADEKLTIPVLSLSMDNQRLMVNLNGAITNLTDRQKIKYDFPHIEIKSDAAGITGILSNFIQLSPQAKQIIDNCQSVSLDGLANGTLNSVRYSGDVSTSLGKLNLNGTLSNDIHNKLQNYKGSLSTDGFNVGELLSKTDVLGMTSLNVNVDATKSQSGIFGNVQGVIDYADVKGYRYKDITADLTIKQDEYEGLVKISDENIKADISGIMQNRNNHQILNLETDVADANLANLNLAKKYPDYKLSFLLKTSVGWTNLSDLAGILEIKDLAYRNTLGSGIGVNDFSVVANSEENSKSKIIISSDFLNGEINGELNVLNIIPATKNILSNSFPSLFSETHDKNSDKTIKNNFTYNFNLATSDEFVSFFKLPVTLLDPLVINGYFDEYEQSAKLDAKVSYIQQKNKLIEGTWLSFDANGSDKSVSMQAHSIIPLKKGNLDLTVAMNGANDRLDTDVLWEVPRETEFTGQMNLSTLFKGRANKSILADVDINPTKLVFNDTAWQVHPAKITIAGSDINVDGFRASCDKQFIAIDGRVSHNVEDQICVELKDINLDYIFETLGIDNVMFGGCATGKFYASDVYSKMPRIATPNLHVENLAYNNAVLGNTDIKSSWDNDTKAVDIHAVIQQKNGCSSSIDGSIFPTMDSLYFDFNTHKVDVKFMKPFMSAFTSDVEGEASGHACLYGNFKRIDLYGDIFADTLRVKLDFTNTYYTASDSIKLRPGNISFKNVKLKDREGHEARLNGWITHEYFHNARFNFSVVDAHDFLCYDVPQNSEQNWFGTIYGDGSVFVNGEPGSVDIDVNMKTSPKSKFTFILSDTEVATEYSFITFRDRGKKNKNVDESDSIPDRVKTLKAKRNETNSQTSSTAYKINLMAEITPQAQMILVMDPVGGDKIRANGEGNIRMTYTSSDEKLSMFGAYTLTKGNYNFTLQDIIVRDFAIREGSTISFNGDPYAAKLDVTAYYQVNANLQDLDETFATDKDMNRTSVPVQALLKVSGDIKEPVIGFDLAFPTLTSEAYRKVRSVISTDDMMNRQIIYLLALSRFYTPEYMGTTSTHNNELASVASSTISSQLSSMLGQLSDNWSISPNFKSDKGDFSDMEVELALSSQLLNNRLLFNGNFGYKDNSMNTRNSNFIGDFDIEYLFTKNGNIRFKAYNHFNDQNYYVKSALTTQGIGVVFKHDFDRFFDFLKKRKKTTNDSVKSSIDGVGVKDSIKR